MQAAKHLSPQGTATPSPGTALQRGFSVILGLLRPDQADSREPRWPCVGEARLGPPWRLLLRWCVPSA